jgi:hypothetical protein
MPPPVVIYRTVLKMADFDWGSVIGGVIGALVTGGAQIFSFHMGKRSAREELARRAESELFQVLYTCDRSLPILTVVESAAGSPNYYSERSRLAGPMLESLKEAEFTLVPQLTNVQLGERFGHFSQLCQKVSGSELAAQDIPRAVKLVREYGQHVRECIEAELKDKPLPPPVPVPSIGA